MELQGKVTGGWRAWANLVRLPNLLTVPGDVLAGFVLVLHDRSGQFDDLLVAVISALCLYMAGLVMNDLIDLEVDRKERPARSIASGAVSKPAARVCIAALFTVALTLLGSRGAWSLASGIGIGALIFAYNMYARRSRLAAALVMGLCRAGSVWLGVVTASPGLPFHPMAAFAPGWWFLLVSSISWLASRETSLHPYGRERWIPVAVIVCGQIIALILLDAASQHAMFRGMLCFIFATMLAFGAGASLGRPVLHRTSLRRVAKINTASIYPKAIGLLISCLIPLQAGLLIYSSGEPWIMLSALLLLFCWPLNRWLAKYFSPS